MEYKLLCFTHKCSQPLIQLTTNTAQMLTNEIMIM